MYWRKIIFLSVLMLFTITWFLHFYPKQETMPNQNGEQWQFLDELSIKYGSGKSSLIHNYTPIYEKHISHMRHEPISLLEIGVFQGSSVMMWENYFTAADIHFIDLTDKHLIYNYTKSKIHLLDQSNQTQLEKFAKEIGRKFDVIIDDGGHKMEEQITTFKVFYPHF